MPELRKKLDLSTIDAATLLYKFRNIFGLIYLKDRQYPVIAALPSQYLIYKNNLPTFYKRNFDFSYSLIPENISLTHFCKLEPNQKDRISGFNGGFAGFIGYDFAAQQHLNIQIESKPQPSLYLGEYRSYLKYEGQDWFFYSDEDDAEAIYQYFISILQLNSPDDQPLQLNDLCQPRWSKAQYYLAYEQIQSYIRAGDCYQINLTQEFKAQATGQLMTAAQALWNITAPPYAGYLKIDNFELLSCSPELFIEFKPNREIITRPIKGTMPRYTDPTRDQYSKSQLIHSQKDQAENVMIVDLLRNDLSIYAEKGSVKTTKLFEIESFNQVHHMVSEVTATLQENIHPVAMLLSALPGGSITGAPKIRAMQIIEELEGAPRGAYCGSMGYFNFDGTGCWNILIRTVQKYEQELSVWAGGGITIASRPDAEYQECFDKVSAMLDLLNTWQRHA